MFKNIGLKGQLLLPVCGLITVIFATLIIGILLSENKTAKDDAVALAYALGEKYGNSVEANLENGMDSIRTVARSFEALSRSGQSLDRNIYTKILKSVFKDNPGFFAVGSIWEPNVISGKDNQYRNVDGHDKYGRYMPYLVKENGNISMVSDVGEDVLQHESYAGPKQKKRR